MQQRIIVTIDGSALADRIITQVKRLLVRKDHEVVLLTVVEPSPEDISGQEERVRDARDHLEGLRDALVDEGALASVRVAVGDPVEEIVSAAERIQPELVAMSTHGRSGLSRLVRGSVAERVVRRCPAPVLVANPRALDAPAEELRFRRILVPIDGSDVSLGALPLVEDLAKLYGAEVLLLRVEWAVPIAAAPYPIEPYPLRSVKEIEETLEPHRARLAQQGIAARSLARYGPEALEILETAEKEDVDLVVMSTHGRSGIARWVFGSVAEQVLRQCVRPLLVRRAFPVAQERAGRELAGAKK